MIDVMKEQLHSYLHENGFKDFDLKAVLFDMDGVLYDSMKHHARSWYETMTEAGYECTSEEFYLHEGRTGASTINLLTERCFNRPATNDEVKSLYARKSELFTRYNNGDVIPYAPEMLNKVKADGLECVLVTGSGQKSLLDRLEQNFRGIFSYNKMVTAFDVKHGKPSPEPYLMGLEKAGHLKPNQAIVVENAPMGVQAASAAGIFTIALTTGPIAPEVLSEAGANIVLPSMQALFNAWEDYLPEFKKSV
ncbi:beta-phosphoglucomutase [Dysgonomonas sp. PH5-45]|uniref:HAD family hydrolase n=1 Tax=unclassified Dysgonomonas TaxID=2630389 RepID=UPI002475519D|nr:MULTISPECIES: HAD-IA family hydrolase [unclassified Dysgonomonas]MDH6353907.1 beta-phosphoglucomutase [Dysgonomonas sp. PH5-45]MDH6386809.1 beta-phosphoglucomutase [Dysgonomonas sp. PH5-37]